MDLIHTQERHAARREPSKHIDFEEYKHKDYFATSCCVPPCCCDRGNESVRKKHFGVRFSDTCGESVECGQ